MILRSALPRIPLVAEASLVLGLLLFAAVKYPSFTVPFNNVDESRGIARSRYFWTTFVQHDIAGADWQPNYQVLTHPPLARYLLGLGLAVQGWSRDQINRYHDEGLTTWMVDASFFRVPVDQVRIVDWTDESVGATPGSGWPSPELLGAARRVSLLLALGALLMMYLVGRQLGGPIVGTMSLVIAMLNPLLATLWTAANQEATLALFSLMSLWLVLRTVSRPNGGPSTARDGIGVGITVGLAMAAKLTATLGAAGLALFALIQQSAAMEPNQRLRRIRAWVISFVTAVLVFVLINPLLYPDPIGRTAMLFQFRAHEMGIQQAAWPDQMMPADIVARVGVIVTHVFVRFPSWETPSDLPLDRLGLFAAVGFGLILARSFREIAVRRTPGPFALWLCWGGTIYIGTIFGMGMAWWQYYVPLVTVNALVEALALGSILRWLGARANSLVRRQAHRFSFAQPRGRDAGMPESV
jgi:4-amino-4-deoxy-L-arabinose transferase-like glycosyltransferase